ncbi:hypothetical protein JQK87_20170 [Streptomyces sp. G44]|uniref:hypothetical protein n=1 Tax=Streptomyces sp. G44 TaxID=2807632 RepID=UPI00196182FE|nr:hypothetical protein [Streptomyces sp. G44]MBM7170666.1 hypothetical protein [Streptomyces sp. G44]
MTQTLPSSRRSGTARPARSAVSALGRPRRALRAGAMAACAPYLALKAAWICGSHLGIPEGSPLLDHRASMLFANGLTVLMDAAVIVLVLVLTRPWGLRTPARLLVPPMWAASGLLVPIMAGFPLTQLAGALGGAGSPATGGGSAEPFLDDWVFGVVYVGFIVQGIALGSLFVLYARDRWGHLWRGRVWDLPRTRRLGGRATAVTAAVLALFPAALHLLWATGSATGLNEGRAEERGSGFHVLEYLNLLYLAMAVAGALILAFRWVPVLPVKVPLALAWLGSGAVGCWGGWLVFGSFMSLGDVTEQPTAVMFLTYAVRMIIGILVAAVGVRFLKERAGSRA